MAKIISPRKWHEDSETGHRYVDYAILLCECGNKVDLRSGLDNTCEICGRNYNMTGQMVYHSRDPRVSEPYECDY